MGSIFGKKSNSSRSTDIDSVWHSNKSLEHHSNKNRSILTVLLFVKLIAMLWNAAVYPVSNHYDSSHHRLAMITCGLEASKYQYNQPLYYLIGCPLTVWSYYTHFPNFIEDIVVPKIRGEKVTTPYFEKHGVKIYQGLKEAVARYAQPAMVYVNIVMVFVFYILMLFRVFPRLLPNPNEWLLAGTILLCFPVIQKLGAMVHPDNLLLLMSPVLFLSYIRFCSHVKPTMKQVAWFALIISLTGLTRPLAVWLVGLFSLMGVWHIWSSVPPSGNWRLSKQKTAKLFVFSSIIIILCSSWWIYRYQQSGSIITVSSERYTARYKTIPSQFDKYKYFFSFPFSNLYQEPNRLLNYSTPAREAAGMMANDSYFLVLFSDFWADHFLYFTPRVMKEEKKGFKQTMLVVALPLTLLLLIGAFIGMVRDGYLLFQCCDKEEKWRFIAAVSGFGGILFFTFYASEIGMEIGKQAQVKGTRIANAVPFIIPAFVALFSKWKHATLSLQYYVYLAYAASLPIIFVF
jgi:hypothetical protein